MVICVHRSKAVGPPPGYVYPDPEAQKTDWTYPTQNLWATQFVLYCAGKAQSPINLDRFGGILNAVKAEPIRFLFYDKVPQTMTATNNGHTVAVSYTSILKPHMWLGTLSLSPYILDSFHFHWGADNTKGSEHTLNSVRYPLELHLVHYRMIHGSTARAADKAEGIAVLGVMFEISTEDNPTLAPLITAMGSITAKDASTTLAGVFAIGKLLPADTKKFYRYGGGFTTPPCNEVVVWTVFQDPITISSTQLATFRTLLDKDGNGIVDNFRNVQPINNRKIWRNFV